MGKSPMYPDFNKCFKMGLIVVSYYNGIGLITVTIPFEVLHVHLVYVYELRNFNYGTEISLT